MSTIIEPVNHELMLLQWRGAQADVCLFHITFRRLGIMLSRVREREALYVLGVSCKQISGPFSWGQADLSIMHEPANQSGEVFRRIIDTQAGFQLLCFDVTLVHGTAGVPPDPFSGFFDFDREK
jgi:hypothetical protein